MGNIGERIKEIRKDTKLSQADFGQALGITSSGVQCWEYNRNEPSSAMIGQICSKWGINRAWLESGTGPMRLQPETADEIIDQVLADGTDLQKAFLRAAAKRPPEELEDMITFLEAVQDEMKGGT